MVEQILKGMEDLKIAMVKKLEDSLSGCRFPYYRCNCYDSTMHNQKDCDEHKEALKHDLIYYEGNRIHSMDFRKLLQPNFHKGGMKKTLEEEMVAQSNYAALTRTGM